MYHLHVSVYVWRGCFPILLCPNLQTHGDLSLNCSAGDCEAMVKQSVPGSVEWAGLEESKSVKVSQFLDSLHDCQDYLFDWSLPLHCPRLAEELTIPRYFAGKIMLAVFRSATIPHQKSNEGKELCLLRYFKVLHGLTRRVSVSFFSVTEHHSHEPLTDLCSCLRASS